jgi:hypothetical protein
VTVCRECGLAANALTCLLKYGQYPLKPAFSVSTWHRGTCGSCGRATTVTEARDFFYPDFSLLSEAFRERVKEEPAPGRGNYSHEEEQI